MGYRNVVGIQLQELIASKNHVGADASRRTVQQQLRSECLGVLLDRDNKVLFVRIECYKMYTVCVSATVLFLINVCFMLSMILKEL